MAPRKAFIIRVDPRILDSIEKWAADEFRSANAQIEFILRKALRDVGRLKSGQESEEDAS